MAVLAFFDVASDVALRLRALIEQCDAAGVDPAEMVTVFERGIEFSFDETERWVRKEARSTQRRAALVV